MKSSGTSSVPGHELGAQAADRAQREHPVAAGVGERAHRRDVVDPVRQLVAGGDPVAPDRSHGPSAAPHRAARCPRSARDPARPQSSLARPVDPLEAIAIFVAGIAAGTINTIVGSGTLITFPVLIALGYQPLVANVSNNIGLVPGRDHGRLRLPARALRPARAGDPARDLLGHRGGCRRDAAARAPLVSVRRDRPGTDRDRAGPRRRAAKAERIVRPAPAARATAARPSAAWSPPAASTAATSARPRASC